MIRTWRFGLLLLLMGVSTALAFRAAAQPERGAARLYMPLIARAQPALAQIYGLAASECLPDAPTAQDSELFRFSAYGSALTQLTDNDTCDSKPRWSPDGTKILWFRDDDVWVMNADGSNPRALNTPGNIIEAKWSPDSEHIALLRYAVGGSVLHSLWVTTPDAAAPTFVAGGRWLFRYVWSPDSAYIAFTRAREYGDTIRVETVRADGTGLRSFGDGDLPDAPWSPDSAWLAYTASVGIDDNLHVARPDGSEIIPLAATPEDENPLRWIENGAALLMERRTVRSAPYPEPVLELIPFPGGGVTPFAQADSPAELEYLDLSPDGVHVVYNVSTYGRTYLFRQAVTPADSPPVAIMPAPDCAPLPCDVAWQGWSDTGAWMAYTTVYYSASSPNAITAIELHVTDFDGSLRLWNIQDERPRWLPHSNWMSAYAAPDGDESVPPRLHLFHAPTHRKIRMPDAPDGARLVDVDWWYER